MLTHDFTGKKAIVTGAAGALGGAVTLALASAGATVLAVDMSAEALSALPRPGSGSGTIVPHVADVRDPDQVRGYAEAGADPDGIDLFFNNAGIEGRVSRLAEIDLDDFRRVQEVNVIGVLLGLQAVLPRMNAGGAVVNTASTAALGGSPGVGSYVASKHAVLGLTRTAAAETREVRINAVCPGAIEGRMMASLDDQRRELLHIDSHAGREYATPEEISDVVLFLLSDAARVLSGQAITAVR